MTNQLTLNEGQEFYANGQRYVIRDGVPVAKAKRGPLGGELVRFDSLKILDCFTITFDKISDDLARCITPCFKTEDRKDTGVVTCGFVEINIPQPQRGRIMTAGEAAKLPDIVGKRVNCIISKFDIQYNSVYLDFGDFGIWKNNLDKIEVID